MFWRLQRQETFPPITSCTLQLVGGKVYSVTVMDMESDRVNFATYKLEGAAGAWWEGFLALQAPGHEVTWAEFCAAFRAAYIPKAVMDGKRKEFLQLTQGKMDIEPYWRAFTRLARYAPRDVTNDEDKQELFRKGMNPALRYEMLRRRLRSKNYLLPVIVLGTKRY